MGIDEIAALVRTVGALDAVLIIGIVMIWREWRKSEAERMKLITRAMERDADIISNYNKFENVIRDLTRIIASR